MGYVNLFFGVLHGMLFCCFISGKPYMFELFSFIFIRVLQPSLRLKLNTQWPGVSLRRSFLHAAIWKV